MTLAFHRLSATNPYVPNTLLRYFQPISPQLHASLCNIEFHPISILLGIMVIHYSLQ